MDSRAAEDLDALRRLCDRAGVDAAGAELIRVYSASIWRLPAADAVAKLATTSDAVDRGSNAVRVTRWLRDADFPCIDPLRLDQPVADAGATATFWRYVPQPARRRLPDTAVLASLLRRLHSAAEPLIELPHVQPTARLAGALRSHPDVLAGSDRLWIQDRMAELDRQYQRIESALGIGLVHNDAHLGNVLPSGAGWLLADWDRVAIGPREWDLVPTANDSRFGLPVEQQERFASAYGFDVTGWPGWPVLRDLYELHSLAAHIRAAPTQPQAAAELRWRLDSLQRGDRSRTWNVIA